MACGQLTDTRIHDQEVKIEEGGVGDFLGIECERHGHFIYASGGSRLASVTVSADSLVSIGGRGLTVDLNRARWNSCNGSHDKYATLEGTHGRIIAPETQEYDKRA